MSEQIRIDEFTGYKGGIFTKENYKEELKKDVSQKIKEENIKAEMEKEKEKELKDKLKRSIMSEDDLKLLLLVFGSRGSTTLLEKVIEKMKKEQKIT
ncbi:MAG: hypothetical protein ABDH28_07945 [Brevinematia bacterium]